MNSTATIFARLTGDATLVALLDTHNGAPAVFSERAPDGYEIGPKPCLVIAADTDGRAVETMTEFGRRIVRDVRGYAPDAGSTLALDTVMERVRTLFHNNPGSLTVVGGVVKISRVTGPTASPTQSELGDAAAAALIGRRVTISLEIQEA